MPRAVESRYEPTCSTFSCSAFKVLLMMELARGSENVTITEDQHAVMKCTEDFSGDEGQ
jgi:putative component of membrane protein insertase Oxa1/YidC/SpoIIIJ protein YidD